MREAIEAAWEGDSISAFGSIIAVTRKLDLATAEFLKGKFVEIIIAPGYDDDALEYLKKKSESIRLMELPTFTAENVNKDSGATSDTYRYITGGMLVQSRDKELFKEWKSVTKTQFPDEKMELAKFIWKAAKNTKSNAIMLGWEYKPGFFQVIGL